MKEQYTESTRPAQGLYDPRFEHDACGIGTVVDIKGRKTHATVDNALKIVEKLEHRAGKDAEGKTGDGVGILIQISHRFFSKAAAELKLPIGGERDYGIGYDLKSKATNNCNNTPRCKSFYINRFWPFFFSKFKISI